MRRVSKPLQKRFFSESMGETETKNIVNIQLFWSFFQQKYEFMIFCKIQLVSLVGRCFSICSWFNCRSTILKVQQAQVFEKKALSFYITPWHPKTPIFSAQANAVILHLSALPICHDTAALDFWTMNPRIHWRKPHFFGPNAFRAMNHTYKPGFEGNMSGHDISLAKHDGFW